MDAENLERLYDTHAEALFRYFCTFVERQERARDLLQDLFVKIARHGGCMAEVRDERAYLFRLAHNLAIDAIRRRTLRREKLAIAAEEAIPVFAEAANPDLRVLRRSLANALGELPIPQREAVYLKLYEEMTFESIAAMLDISANTAASRYRYGIGKLRQRLRPLYEEINENT